MMTPIKRMIIGFDAFGQMVRLPMIEDEKRVFNEMISDLFEPLPYESGGEMPQSILYQMIEAAVSGRR